MYKKRRLLVLAAVGTLIVGCAPSSPPLKAVAPATLPPGYVLKDVPKYGISIGIAPGWKFGSGEVADPMASFSAETGETISPEAQHSDSDLGKFIQSEQAAAQAKEKEALEALEAKGVIIRVNTTGKTTFGEDPTRYQVKIMPNPSSSLEGAAESVREHVPGEEKPVAVTLPVGPAMVVKADKKMVDGGEVTTSKYVIQDGKTLIVVSFVTEENPTVIRSIEGDVMNTLRIVPGKAVPPKDAQ